VTRTVLLRGLLLGALALLPACATTDEKKADGQPDLSAPDGGSVPQDGAPEAPAALPPDGGTEPPSQAVPAAPGESDAGVAAAPEPPEPEPVRSYDPAVQEAFGRAARAADQGDAATAERELREALSREPRADFAWTNLGILQERTSVKEAEASYRKALSFSPDQDRAWDALGRLMCRTGRCDAFIQEARARTQKRPAARGPRNALAFALVQTGSLEEAAAEAKRVLKDDERNVRAMQVLAQVFARQKKWELARTVLENARLIDPRDAATHNALGLVQLQLKTTTLRAQAMESFATAARLKPDFAEALSNHGAILNEAQDFESAVPLLERAVAAAPDYAPAHMNLGNAYRGTGKLEQARAAYERVLALQPKDVDPWFNLAILYLDSEVPNVDTIVRYETAMQHFETFTKSGGKDERVEQYVKDAKKAIEKEKRRRERAEKDKLRKAEKDAREAEKRAAEEAAAKKAAEEAEKKAAEEAAKKAADEAARAPAEPVPAEPAPAAAPPSPSPAGGAKLEEPEEGLK
jgi:Tfp pilus assembly protein PilF